MRFWATAGAAGNRLGRALSSPRSRQSGLKIAEGERRPYGTPGESCISDPHAEADYNESPHSLQRYAPA